MHIASGAFVRSSFRSSRFLMHSITGTVHANVLKLLILIPHEKIAGRYFFSTGVCPFPELWPFEKKYGCNLVSKISQKLLKLET